MALIRSLFGPDQPARELAGALEVSVGAERFVDAAAFIENERRCCPHLAFSLEVPMAGAPLVLRVVGLGAALELRAATC